MNATQAAAYVRVSTRDQNKDTQLQVIRGYAKRRGLQLSEYIDEGESGASASRPALDRLLADARLRLFDVVIVWKFDRAARSVGHLDQMLKEFQALGIEFASLTEALDTSTPAGRLMFHVLGSVAEFERDLIRERVIAGMERARREGKKFGRPGYQVDELELLRMRDAGHSVYRDV